MYENHQKTEKLLAPSANSSADSSMASAVKIQLQCRYGRNIGQMWTNTCMHTCITSHHITSQHNTIQSTTRQYKTRQYSTIGVYIYIHMYHHIYIACMSVSNSIGICMHIHTSIYIYIYIYIYKYIYIYICIYIYIYICICIYIYGEISKFLLPGFGRKALSLQIYRTQPYKFNSSNKPKI